MINDITKLQKIILNQYLKPGDTVIDATCGNGNDTLYLCEKVEKNGKVYGFDIQDAAIENTEKLLTQNQYTNYKLIKTNNKNINKYIQEKIKCCIYNLGYLPGSDKKIITQPKDTIESIENVLELLEIGGIISIAIYLKHDYGYEGKKVINFIKSLNKKTYKSILINPDMTNNFSPQLVFIEKIR